MFGIFFGKYLMDKAIITKDQFYGLMEATRNTKVKMGLLAVEAGLMSTTQADEVNMLQQQEDKRFGDIAIEKGYLSEDDVTDLLEQQGDSYLLYLQALMESGLMGLDEVQSYMNDYKKQMGFSALDIDAIKSGDIDRIAPVFMKDDTISVFVKDYISLTARNVVRFVDRFFRLSKIEKINTYTAARIAGQEIDGDYKMFTAFCGDEDSLHLVAKGFVSTLLTGMGEDEPGEEDIDTLDGACEFLNVNNGLYATKMGEENVDIDMEPPVMKNDIAVIKSNGDMYRIPIFIDEKQIDLVICLGEEYSLE